MEGQRGDAAYIGTGGRVARCISGDALFPAQDAENKFSDRVLGDCPGVAGSLVEVLERKTAFGLRGCNRPGTDVTLYRSQRNYPRKQHRVSDPTLNASHMYIVIMSSFHLLGPLLDIVLCIGRHGRYTLERSLRVARRGVLQLTCRSHYGRESISAQ
jgi:hypothetical protein